MAFLSTTNIQCTCSFGAAPAILSAKGQAVLAERLPVAVITDLALPAFGTCMSLANPAVQAATSAAGGVLTPQPCTPMLAAPWTPGSVNVLVQGNPVLNNTCRCVCSFGGMVQIIASPVSSVHVP